MSAEELGRRLLGEVEEEGLDGLLHSLRLLNESEPISRLGIPPVDRLLHVFQPGVAINQTVQPVDQLSSSPRQIAHGVQQRRIKFREPVIEITSGGPGAGTNHLLYLITAIAVLPPTYNGIELNGKHQVVIVIDTDGRFSVARLAEVTRHYVEQRRQRNEHQQSDAQETATPSGAEWHDLLRNTLQHVHIFRPQSLSSLLATLSSLPTYLFTRSAHPSTSRALHSIIISSATAFYWQSRAEEEHARLGGLTLAPTAQNQCARLVHHLRALQRKFACLVVATTWALYDPPASQHATLGRPLLPRPWPAYPTLRIAVARVGVPRFAPRVSVEEALRESEEGRGAAERARFEAWVDGWGSEEWSERVWEEMRRGSGFGFSVGEDGIVVEGM